MSSSSALGSWIDNSLGNTGSYASNNGWLAKSESNRTTLLISQNQADDAAREQDAALRSEDDGDVAATESRDAATAKKTSATGRMGTRAVRGSEGQRIARRAAERSAMRASGVDYREVSRAVVLDTLATDAAFNAEDLSPEGGVIELISNATAQEPWSATQRSYDVRTPQANRRANESAEGESLQQAVASFEAVDMAAEHSEASE